MHWKMKQNFLLVFSCTFLVGIAQAKDYSALLSSSRCTPLVGSSSKNSSYTCKKEVSVKIKAKSTKSRKEDVSRSTRESREDTSSIL